LHLLINFNLPHSHYSTVLIDFDVQTSTSYLSTQIAKQKQRIAQ
jgi:hypothetical protein